MNTPIALPSIGLQSQKRSVVTISEHVPGQMAKQRAYSKVLAIVRLTGIFQRVLLMGWLLVMVSKMTIFAADTAEKSRA